MLLGFFYLLRQLPDLFSISLLCTGQNYAYVRGKVTQHQMPGKGPFCQPKSLQFRFGY